MLEQVWSTLFAHHSYEIRLLKTCSNIKALALYFSAASEEGTPLQGPSVLALKHLLCCGLLMTTTAANYLCPAAHPTRSHLEQMALDLLGLQATAPLI